MASDNTDDYQATIFANRLAKRYKLLRKWARKNGVTCYRLYDRDIPEVPLAVDVYELLPAHIATRAAAAQFLAAQNERISQNDSAVEKEIAARRYATLYEYERTSAILRKSQSEKVPHALSAEKLQHTGSAEKRAHSNSTEKRPAHALHRENSAWILLMANALAAMLGIARSHVIVKTRKHAKGGSQYADGAPPQTARDVPIRQQRAISGMVQESGLLFSVDLTSHIDTGLFFDMRLLRAIIRETARGKRVLNLYCYTASFSVYAAAGGAAAIDSVDLSNTYLAWAQENMHANGFCDEKKYRFFRADVKEFLARTCNAGTAQKNNEQNTFRNAHVLAARYDIIILDPPTFSNSKMARTMLDINRDWAQLVNACVALLSENGVLYFSTNSRRLKFDETLIAQPYGSPLAVEEITAQTMPRDFERTKAHRVWKIAVQQ
ncbi:MAG: class I SAM-dependent methyltransferase [Treponema sp.]|nr:class I SAM-dependent methyltransferase [Treponema sp.]